MNFLSIPSGPLELNSEFDEEQLQVAEEFFAELESLGVLLPLPEGMTLEANCPLFVVPKPGQPGQWRVIADMKRGGQNAHIGQDPVHLPRASDILPMLTPNGWMAMIDASKFFYNFPTCENERKYLGCIHPRTGHHYVYAGLPMGSANSPAVACRLGVSMLRSILDECGAFQGQVMYNTIGSSLEGTPYRKDIGTGRVRIGRDGTAAALAWGHVDDFLIHAPTREKLIQALNAIMDKTVALGFMCQKVKTTPPTQHLKYCGFMYDTTGVPYISIPDEKRSRALASLTYLETGCTSTGLSRLTLSVVIGLLQSFVEATPQNIGGTFLRRAYRVLHDMDGTGGTSHLEHGSVAFYHTRVELPESIWLDLNWWKRVLRADVRRYSSCQVSGTLAVSWGDGSGTGTGANLQLMDSDSGPCPEVTMWMGTWTASVHHFSSNWKELRTLMRVLERDMLTKSFCGRMVFYFTDNEVTYNLIYKSSSGSPGLMALIREIKYLELCLGCQLEVIHVPGTLMIQEGGDMLSRGVWMAPERLRMLPQEETARVFRALPSSPSLISWMVAQAAALHPSVVDRHWSAIGSDDLWHGSSIIGQSTCWFPAPETARQVLNSILYSWVEAPLATEMLVLIPRVMRRAWRRVNKHILELGVFLADTVPLAAHFGTDIPVVLLYLPRHVRRLPDPSHRVEQAPVPGRLRWHSEQADHVRGL